MQTLAFMELRDHVIGRRSIVIAHIVFSGWLRVDGEVIGTVRAQRDRPARLVVGRDGRIQGKVSAPDIVVLGRIDGKVSSEGRIQVRKTGCIIGTVLYRSLELVPGGIVSGRLQFLAPA